MNGDSSICNGCQRSEPEIRFSVRTVNGKKYREHLCVSCNTQYKKKYPASKESLDKAQKKYKAKKKKLRRIGADKEKFILEDCKKWDRKHGFVCDLTLDSIKSIISNGCSYCGDINARVGLDRINNAIGHSLSNVVAACTRCNYLRRDMPHEAWMILVPAVKIARESGAFGTWDGFGRKKKTESGQDDNAPDC